ncbi:unnamed protein product [Closterium sp. Yama58-4]|nr:unnamed protein product [Closterium sp. Yama58-4]
MGAKEEDGGGFVPPAEREAWVPPLAAQQWGQTTTAGIIAGMMLGASREAARTQASSPFSVHHSHRQQHTTPPSTAAAPPHAPPHAPPRASPSSRYAAARLAAEQRLVRVVRASVAGGAQLGALAGVFSASQLGLRALMLAWREEQQGRREEGGALTLAQREEGVAQRRRTHEGGGSSSSSSGSGSGGDGSARSGEAGGGDVGRDSRGGWQGEELCEPDVASTVGAGAITAGLVGLVATHALPAHRLKAAALHTIAGAALALPLVAPSHHLPLPNLLPLPPLSLCAPPAAILHSALYSLLPQQHSTAATHDL